MKGERAKASFAAAVILHEVCRRAGRPLAVLGYNRRAMVLLDFENDGAGWAAAPCLETILQADGGGRGGLDPSGLCDEVTRILSSFISDLYGLRAAA